jgi:hypothetical protein
MSIRPVFSPPLHCVAGDAVAVQLPDMFGAGATSSTAQRAAKPGAFGDWLQHPDTEIAVTRSLQSP